MKVNELCVELDKYFETTKGTGVLATADDKGNVDVAVYARPHVLDKDRVAFIMADRKSYKNLQSNHQAAYLFMEEGEHYTGKRMYLTKIDEETDMDKIRDMMRRKDRKSAEKYEDVKKFLVHFRIDKVIPLIGDEIQCF